jgi:hypothetical protein
LSFPLRLFGLEFVIMRVPFVDRPHSELRRRIQPVRPIGYEDLCLMADAIADASPNWTVELSCISPGEASLVVMPEGADDLIGPTYIVYQDRGTFHLDQFQWDELCALGTYSCFRDAVLAIVGCITCLSVVSPASSTMRH